MGTHNTLLRLGEKLYLEVIAIDPAVAKPKWQSQQHPASRLEDRGSSLASLKGFHPDAARINDLLRHLGCASEIYVEEDQRAHLVAEIQTPHGLRTLGA